MPHIRRVLAVPAAGAGYCEDLAALQSQSTPVQDRYTARPVTPGFRAVREPAEAVSVGLVLDDGEVAWGDCVAVSYSGKAGREPVFRAAEGLRAIQGAVAAALEGRGLTSFRALAGEIDSLTESVPGQPGTHAGGTTQAAAEQRGVSRRGLLAAPLRAVQTARSERPPAAGAAAADRPLHSAVRYGVSQALVQAIALARRVTMAEVIADEWRLPSRLAPVPIHAQSGSQRYDNADKMIIRRLASLPHALVDDIPAQMGTDGSALTDYIRWLRQRIAELGGEEYRPTIHLDVHGALGVLCDCQPGRMLGRLYGWEAAARPLSLRIECPVMLDSRAAQIDAMRRLREYVRARGMTVQLVADEWANTLDDIQAFVDAQAADMIQIKMPDLGSVHNSVEAVLACKASGVGALVGGSYAETDVSARVSVHVAMATQADLVMAKPGLGVDEAVSLVHNEMARTVAAAELRERGPVP